MKNSLRKRIIALGLCAILAFNGSISGFANEALESEPAVATIAEEVSEPVTEAVTEPITEAVVEEPSEPATEAVIEEATEAQTEEETELETEESELGETTTESEVESETEESEVEETELETESETETEEESETETEEETEEVKEIVLETKVKGTIIKMSGPSTSFPEGTDYRILAKELTSDQKDDVEVALRKMELENETKVVSYQAYDIKLIVDGNEAQPLGEVKVTFEGGAVEEKVEGADNVEVFHINEVAQEAEPIVNEVNANTVEMTTDHFSTYVITITTQVDVTVTVEHYQGEGANAKQLYRTREYPLTFQTKLDEIAVQTTHYKISKIVKYVGNRETVLYQANNTDNETVINQVLEADARYRVYYTPSTDTESGGVQMFDYQVDVRSGNTKTSINDVSNYSSSSGDNQRLAVGSHNHTLSAATNKDGTNINKFNNSDPVTNIITGVNYQTGALEMATGTKGQLYEPGLFTQDAKIGKQVLSGYELEFSRNGDSYQLTRAKKNGTTVATSGADFFPLDSISYPQENKSADQGHNYYFGMRYDITFKIGEYVGDLTYEFTGDDDLWVVLDAKDDGGQVVIDVGGIHRAATRTIDLWSVLDPDGGNDLRTKSRESLSDAERAVLEKEHTLTILYMERGAGDSNCSMKFTLPNSRIVDPVINNVNFALTVEKTVSGLTEDEFDALKEDLVFKVTPTNGGVASNNGYALFNEAVKEIPATSLTWTENTTTQTYTGTYTLYNVNSYLNQFEYTVSEEHEEVLGYDVSTSVTANNLTEMNKKSATVVFNGQNTTKSVAFVNSYTPKTTQIEVTKLWKDAGNAYGTRPGTISFTLQWKYTDESLDQTWNDYDSNDADTDTDVFVMNTSHVDPSNRNVWKYTVSGLSMYKAGNAIEYQAVEVIEANSNVAKYYASSTNGTTMTNRFDVQIVKVSSTSDGQSAMIPLEGAEFKLTSSGTTYYGKSDAYGIIVWYSDQQRTTEVDTLADGNYTFSESKAPAGYVLSTESWNIEVIDGVMKLPQSEIDTNKVVGKVYTAYFENTPLYELPSTGSLGIYWYMIAGTMMMMVATAITYKNRREEVLERVDK